MQEIKWTKRSRRWLLRPKTNSLCFCCPDKSVDHKDDAEDNDVEGQEGCVGEHEQEGGGSGVN